MTVADSVRVDEAGGRDHQVTPSDAEAHLDGGALAAAAYSRWRVLAVLLSNPRDPTSLRLDASLQGPSPIVESRKTRDVSR